MFVYLERWLSGLKRHPAKVLASFGARRFESSPLRLIIVIMIEHISNEDEQKQVRGIYSRWESFWKDEDMMDMMAKDLLCSPLLPSILPKEINKAIKEHGLDLVEVQPMEPPKKL